MHKDCNDPDKHFPADFFQFPPPPPPPPPSFEFPDLSRRTLVRRGPEPRETRSPVRNPLDYAFEDRDRIICVSNCPAQAFHLSTNAHASCSIHPLIIDRAMFRRIEALDLAVKLRTSKQTQQDAKSFDRNNEFVSTNRSQSFAGEGLYGRSATVESCFVDSGQSSSSPTTRLVTTVDRCLCLQGRLYCASNRFRYPCAAKTGRALHSTAGVQHLFGEYPRSITARDIRRWCKVVTRMPVIEETEKVSSGDEDQDPKVDSGEVSGYQPSNFNESHNMESEAAPPKVTSLLDLMHKRYCPNQYSKSQPERWRLKTNLSANLEESTTPKSLQLTPNTSDGYIGDANSRCLRRRLRIDEPTSCKPDGKVGRNLAPLLSSPVSVSSSQGTPAASPSSVHSLESPPLLSPSSWDGDDAIHHGEGDTDTEQLQTTPEAWNDTLTTQLESCYSCYEDYSNSNARKVS